MHIIYVGSPHIAHYQDCKLALEGGKHCLVEKPATLNAAEWRDLVRIAKEKKVFLMEGELLASRWCSFAGSSGY